MRSADEPQMGTFNSGGELVMKIMPMTVPKEKTKPLHLKSDCIKRHNGLATKILALTEAGEECYGLHVSFPSKSYVETPARSVLLGDGSFGR